ncbi:hypothetical protein QQ045_002199 [Rhodiola kirilowii]
MKFSSLPLGRMQLMTLRMLAIAAVPKRAWRTFTWVRLMIDTATIPLKTTYTPSKQLHYNQEKTSEFIIKLLQFLVPLIVTKKIDAAILESRLRMANSLI